MNEESDISSLIGNQTINAQISTFRALMGISKTEFAHRLHFSRVTVDKIENSNYMTQEIGYKIFYIAYKAYQNMYNSELLRLYAKSLMDRIGKEVLDCKVKTNNLSSDNLECDSREVNPDINKFESDLGGQADYKLIKDDSSKKTYNSTIYKRKKTALSDKEKKSKNDLQSRVNNNIGKKKLRRSAYRKKEILA